MHSTYSMSSCDAPALVLSLALCLGTLVGPSTAWGTDGHAIIAHIADQLLSPEAREILHTDLEGLDLNPAASWADSYDHESDGKWSADLHFIDFTGKVCNFNWQRDCATDECNAGAIVNYSKRLRDQALSKEDRFEALKFVIHMVGDIHQPLHTGSGDDHGGNSIKINAVHFHMNTTNTTIVPNTTHTTNTTHTHHKKRKTNLHAVWDTAIISEAIHDAYNSQSHPVQLQLGTFVPHWDPHMSSLTGLLLDRLQGEWHDHIAEWQEVMTHSIDDEATFRNGLAAVANESATLACRHAYSWPNGTSIAKNSVLDRDYYLFNKPVVEEQLAKGGVRLAKLLSDILEPARAIVV